jgi:hypothetical protein
MKLVFGFLIFLFGNVFSSVILAQMTCNDIRGIRVRSIPDETINDIAIANLAQDGSPVIYYRPSGLISASPPTQLFFYAHECGHHALGHNIGLSFPLTREQEADCFAIRTLVKMNLVSDDDINAIQNDINHFKGDWTHLPGPERAINLRACLNGTSNTTDKIVSDDQGSETNGIPAATNDDDCQENYKTCKLGLRTNEQCIQEEYPERCITQCVQLGISQSECMNQKCLPTASNMSNWVKRCRFFIAKEELACLDERSNCKAQ